MPSNHRQLLAQAQSLFQQGQLAPAEKLLRQLLAARPRDADALLNLGIICTHTQRLPEAIDLFQQALAAKPYFFEALGNLACVYQLAGRHPEAITAFQNLLKLQPNHPLTHYNLGASYKSNNQFEEAAASYRRAIELKPDYADANYNLGNALRALQKPDEAIAAYKEALRLNPKHIQACNNLGHAHKDKHEYDEALALFQHALAINPQFTESIAALADTLRGLGQVAESVPLARKVLQLTPNDPLAGTVWLYTQEYLPDQNPAHIFEEYKKWGQRHAPTRSNIPTYSNDRTPNRRLRIGYVSPDFRKHAVASFIENVFESHDPSVVEVFCYSDTPHPDAVTARLQSLVPHWRDTSKLDIESFVQAVRSDQIDILVDLAGHTAGNRLLAFAAKPAPIQVTYLGHPDTTGVAAIDYRFTDALADPPSITDPFHTETLIRLPAAFLNFRPDPESPPVNPLPALAAGHITFGSFNVLPKITPEMIQTWAALLQRIPTAKLLLKNYALKSAAARNRILSLFAQSQIHPERIALHGPIDSAAGHLALYHQIDIALDTSPYHGTTTTCEALWMGVPVVSLIGRRHVSRVGLSLLTNVGLPSLAIQTPEDYISSASRLAADLPALAEMRAALRPRMQASPLMDKATFARSVESAYREMWHRWRGQEQDKETP